MVSLLSMCQINPEVNDGLCRIKSIRSTEQIRTGAMSASITIKIKIQKPNSKIFFKGMFGITNFTSIVNAMPMDQRGQVTDWMMSQADTIFG